MRISLSSSALVGRLALCVLVAQLWLSSETACAAESFSLHVDRYSAPAVELQSLKVVFRPLDSPSLSISVASMTAGEIQLNNIAINCAKTVLTSVDIECDELVGSIVHPKTNLPIALSGAVKLDLLAQSATLDLGLGVDGASARILGFVGSDGSGALTMSLASFQLALLQEVLARTGVASISGDVSGELQVQIEDFRPAHASFDLTFNELAFDTENGEYAGAGIKLKLTGDANYGSERVATELTLHWDAGEFLAGTLYLPTPESPMALALVAEVTASRLEIQEAVLDDGDALRVAIRSASMTWETPFDLQGVLTLERAMLEAVNRRYLGSLTAASGFASTEMQGEVSGQIRLDGLDRWHAELTLEDVFTDDNAGRFSVAGLSGQLSWSQPPVGAEGQLDWDGLSLYRINFGEANFRYAQTEDGISMLEPTTVPVMDGSLALKRFGIHYVDGEIQRFDLIATLNPISMEALSAALEWPRLSGSISGEIPAVRYRNGVVAIDGAVEFNAFDGRITLQDLRLERPFGVLPSMAANIEVDRIDLAILTRAFEFGLIEGQLSGHVRGLRMLNWSPVAFEAALANPKDDPTPHRISQRAVENISSIGGSGAGAALSRGFLSFFDDFSYHRLAITCTLKDDVCQMGGVEPTGSGGYYLVKGAGIPRLDVVGFAREVDWPTLVSRLKAASSAGEVTVN